MSDPSRPLQLPCLSPLGTTEGHYRADAPICLTCAGDVQKVLLTLPRDYYDLSQAIARNNAPLDGPTAPNKPASKPPMNLVIDALRSQIVYTAALWEEVIRDRANLPPRRDGAMREGPSLVLSVRILAPRIDVLSALPPTDGYFDGVECGLVRRSGMAGIRRLLALHDTARRVLGLSTTVIRLPGACASCTAEAIRREHGSETVWCDNCGGRWTYREYELWVRLEISVTTPVEDRS